ncbi:hypothetical protein L915_13482 [Phytophthora nicotianae]|uniref:Uncharacterized protein n=1 Tax=Phytophthora nicotianae TaxID=4792 RepID=W2GFG6_PHYNI|nr:hypothetical protein L915_13482 [Phytophthora nicotianae]
MVGAKHSLAPTLSVPSEIWVWASPFGSMLSAHPWGVLMIGGDMISFFGPGSVPSLSVPPDT